MTITTATYNNTPEKRENTQVTISKTVSTAASRYNIHTYKCIPFEHEETYISHIEYLFYDVYIITYSIKYLLSHVFF